MSDIELQAVFDRFNADYFAGGLPLTTVVWGFPSGDLDGIPWREPPSAMTKWDDHGEVTVYLNEETQRGRGQAFMENALLHEMVHVSVGEDVSNSDPHGAQFIAECERIARLMEISPEIHYPMWWPNRQ